MPSRFIKHSQNPPSLESDTQIQNAMNRIHTCLINTVEQVLRHEQDMASTSNRGVYIGLGGIALLYRRLSSSSLLLDELEQLPASLLSSRGDHALLTCLKNLSPPATTQSTRPSKVSFLETDIGVASLVLERLLELSQENSTPLDQSPFFKRYRLCSQLIRNAVESVNDYEEDSCEVLYGRAGLLYALLRIRSRVSKINRTTEIAAAGAHEALYSELDAVVSDNVLRSVVDSIIAIGRQGAKEYADQLLTDFRSPTPRLMWVWHGGRYLGAAHGVAGILFVLWSCPVTVVQPYADELVNTLEWLVGLQDSAGNWPSKAPDDNLAGGIERMNDLVQWCHGATGILMLLSKVSRQRADLVLNPSLHDKIKTAIRRGARVVYKQGLLTKGVGICHGVAGSTYALLAASQALDGDPLCVHDLSVESPETKLTDENAKYLRRAVHLAMLATDFGEFTRKGDMETPDRPWSLYEGSAGMCCAWMDILYRVTGRAIVGMPGFDDL